MKSYHSILKEFLESKFSRAMGDSILQIYLKKKGFSSAEALDALPMKEQLEFIKFMLNGVFGSFYPAPKIISIYVMCILKFATYRATDQVQQMLHTDAELKDISLSSINEFEFTDIAATVANESNGQVLYFVLSGDIQGVLCSRLPLADATSLGKMVVERMMGQQADESLSRQSVVEFYNMLLSKFTDVIGESYNAKIRYVPGTAADYATACADKSVSTSMLQMTFGIDRKQYKPETIIIINRASEQLTALMQDEVNKAKSADDDHIPVTAIRSGDPARSAADFLIENMDRNMTLRDLEQAAASSYARSVDHLSADEIQKIISYLVDHRRLEVNLYKKRYLIKNLQHIYAV